jgi:hypothetical protein
LPCPVLRGRKSRYASVGMTTLLGTDKRMVQAVFHPIGWPLANDSCKTKPPERDGLRSGGESGFTSFS